MREADPVISKRVSLSLIGQLGADARRWKGNKASYVAKHAWLTKHYDKGSSCEDCLGMVDGVKIKRLEWANISGEYLRERSDYKVLCPSCHRKQDLASDYCKNGHERTNNNTKYRNGWKVCKDCLREASRRFRNAKTN